MLVFGGVTDMFGCSLLEADEICVFFNHHFFFVSIGVFFTPRWNQSLEVCFQIFNFGVPPPQNMSKDGKGSQYF